MGRKERRNRFSVGFVPFSEEKPVQERGSVHLAEIFGVVLELKMTDLASKIGTQELCRKESFPNNR